MTVSVAHLRIKLDDVEPAVVRRVEVPLTIRLDRLQAEDVGGPGKYREFLNAIADPNHPEHVERLQWIGGHFDATNTKFELLAQTVHSLAKKWDPQIISP